MSEYAPGTVALVNGDVCLRLGNGRWEHGKPNRFAYNESTADVRPLLVIDPEDREQVERLVRACPADWAFTVDEETVCECVDGMHAALRTLLAAVAEPQETGFLVRARWQSDDGTNYGMRTWSRAESGEWVCLSDGDVGRTVAWAFLRDLEVLDGPR